MSRHTLPPRDTGRGGELGTPLWDWGVFWESPAFPCSLPAGRSPSELWAPRSQLQLSQAPETWPQCHGDGLAAHPRCHGVPACRLQVPLRGWQEAGDSQAPCPPPACPLRVLNPCPGVLPEGRGAGTR